MKLLVALVVAFVCGCSSDVLPWVAQERAERRADEAEAATRAVAAELAAMKAEYDGRCPALRSGESLWGFARRNQVSAADIMIANGMTADAIPGLRGGMRLCTPPASPLAGH